MIAPLTLFLILIPPALVAWRGVRVHWTMAAGVMGLALFGLTLWMALAGAWPFAPKSSYHDTYYVVAHWHYTLSMSVLVAAIMVAQAIKARRGSEDRRPTLALFGLLMVGLTLMLAPLAFDRPTGLTPTVSTVSEIGGVLALAGFIGLFWLILMRPALRWLGDRL